MTNVHSESSNFSLYKAIPAVIWVLVAVSFILIPSVDFLPFQNPTVSGKFVVFMFAIELSGFIFLVRSTLDNRSINVSKIDIWIFALLAFISFNRYINQPIHGFSIRFLELIGLYMVYLILRSSKSEKILYVLCFTAIIGANVQIIIGFLQLYGFIHSNHQFFKITGSFFNSGPLAGYLVSVFSITLFFFKNQQAVISKLSNGKDENNSAKTAFFKWSVIFNLIGCLAILPILKSRASLIALIAVILLVYRNEILSAGRKIVKTSIVKYIGITLLILVVVVGSLSLFNAKKGSSKGRFLILKVASEMIADKPIFGFGFDRFRSNYMDYQAGYFKTNLNEEEGLLADNTIYAFNEPMQFLVENGIAGLVLAIGVIFVLLKNADKSNDLFWLACSGLAAILIFSCFSYPTEILPIKLMLFLYLAILANANKGGRIEIKLKNKPGFLYKLSRAFFIIAVVVCFIMSFGQTVGLATFFHRWEIASLKYEYNLFAKAKVDYSHLHTYGGKNGDFLAEYGKVLFFTNDYQEGIGVLNEAKLYVNNAILETTLADCQLFAGDYANAEKSYLQACLMKPNSFYSKYQLLNLYKKSDQKDKGVKTAQDILKLRVKVKSDATDEIRKEAALFLKTIGE